MLQRKTRLNCAAVVGICTVLIYGVPVSAANDVKEEKEILGTLETMVLATIKKDIPTLEKVYHADLSYGHSSGRKQTKAEVLKEVAGPGTLESMTFTNPKVQIYGSTALIHNAYDIRTINGSGEKVDNHLDAMWVLLKGSGGWQILARHTTRPR